MTDTQVEELEPTEPEPTEAGAAFAAEAATITLTINDLAERDLTPRETGLLMTNHTHALMALQQIVERQESLIATLMYTLAAYTRQYPLDLDKLQAGDLSPLVITNQAPVEDEPPHWSRPGTYL